MQKAFIVRNAVENPAGLGWSYEVDCQDMAPPQSLRTLLADGWRVVQLCPMPSELDCCCLVIVEKSASRKDALSHHADDVPVHELATTVLWNQAEAHHSLLRRSPPSIDTIPLQRFVSDSPASA